MEQLFNSYTDYFQNHCSSVTMMILGAILFIVLMCFVGIGFKVIKQNLICFIIVCFSVFLMIITNASQHPKINNDCWYYLFFNCFVVSNNYLLKFVCVKNACKTWLYEITAVLIIVAAIFAVINNCLKIFYFSAPLLLAFIVLTGVCIVKHGKKYTYHYKFLLCLSLLFVIAIVFSALKINSVFLYLYLILYLATEKVFLMRNFNYFHNRKIFERFHRIHRQLDVSLVNNNLKLMVEELQKSNETKDRFFSIIAHDIKSPVSSIKTITEFLVEDSHRAGYDEIIKLADSLKISVENLHNLLENLLTWSRSQLGTMKCIPEILKIDDIINNLIITLQGPYEQKKIKLSFVKQGAQTIFADENMLLTVLRNLLTNSLKFSFPDSEVKVNFTTEGNYSVIKVIDYGVGMMEKKARELFKLDKVISSNGTSEEPGTGLGLVICRDFISKHNGTIQIDSEDAKGTQVIVKIPLNNII